MVNLGGYLSDPSGIFTLHQKITIQKIAVASSIISLFATLVGIYWFILLRKNFRRNLIFLLILADFFKSLWYLSFSGVALSLGGIETTSNFCQANGWLLQACLLACDWAILFMSLHMYLQIFSITSKTFGHDGLYRFRHTVLGLYIAIPSVSASLAFVNVKYGYRSQGPFCTLPIRPYWYRLALAWIPRYLIWSIVMFIALRIYFHVGDGFTIFTRQKDRISTGDNLGSLDTSATRELGTLNKEITPPSDTSSDHHDGIAPHALVLEAAVTSRPEVQQQLSYTTWPPAFTLPVTYDEPRLTLGSESRRGSRVHFQMDLPAHMDVLAVPPEQKRLRGSITTISTIKSYGDASMDCHRPPVLEPITEIRSNQLEEGVAAVSGDSALKTRRRAIQRQLRLLFIYPAVYMIMWAIPFVHHSMNYSDYYAQHPIYILRAVAVACQIAMGTVDCIIFGWREKPWKHIPGSDGTFLGSFMFWRFRGGNALTQWSTPVPGQIPNGQETSLHEGTANSRPRVLLRSTSYPSMRHSHQKTWSGSSDRTAMESELAVQRLALERADRERQSASHSRAGSLIAPSKSTEWWDRRLSDAVYDTPYDGTQDVDLH